MITFKQQQQTTFKAVSQNDTNSINERTIIEKVENIVTKVEISHGQLLHLIQYFQKSSPAAASESVWERVNFLKVMSDTPSFTDLLAGNTCQTLYFMVNTFPHTTILQQTT